MRGLSKASLSSVTRINSSVSVKMAALPFSYPLKQAKIHPVGPLKATSQSSMSSKRIPFCLASQFPESITPSKFGNLIVFYQPVSIKLIPITRLISTLKSLPSSKISLLIKDSIDSRTSFSILKPPFHFSILSFKVLPVIIVNKYQYIDIVNKYQDIIDIVNKYQNIDILNKYQDIYRNLHVCLYS